MNWPGLPHDAQGLGEQAPDVAAPALLGGAGDARDAAHRQVGLPPDQVQVVDGRRRDQAGLVEDTQCRADAVLVFFGFGG